MYDYWNTASNGTRSCRCSSPCDSMIWWTGLVVFGLALICGSVFLMGTDEGAEINCGHVDRLASIINVACIPLQNSQSYQYRCYSNVDYYRETSADSISSLTFNSVFIPVPNQKVFMAYSKGDTQNVYTTKCSPLIPGIIYAMIAIGSIFLIYAQVGICTGQYSEQIEGEMKINRYRMCSFFCLFLVCVSGTILVCVLVLYNNDNSSTCAKPTQAVNFTEVVVLDTKCVPKMDYGSLWRYQCRPTVLYEQKNITAQLQFDTHVAMNVGQKMTVYYSESDNSMYVTKCVDKNRKQQTMAIIVTSVMIVFGAVVQFFNVIT